MTVNCMDRSNFLLKRRFQYIGILFVVFVLLLRYLGVIIISVSLTALYAYIPFLLVLLAVWYVVNRLL